MPSLEPLNLSSFASVKGPCGTPPAGQNLVIVMMNWKLSAVEFLAVLIASSAFATPISVAAGSPDTVDRALARVRAHDFHPLDERRFTIDRALKQNGVADLDDTDWKVRLLTVRDLVRAGKDAAPRIAQGLSDPNVQVRYVCAVALGVLKAASASDDLQRVVREDADALARSQAVMALGQIESAGSLDLLRGCLEKDPSRDVRHQCELAIGQIQKKMGATDELSAAFRALDPATFETVQTGAPAPDFTLPDTEGQAWRLGHFKDKNWVVLIWVFADWCPVCHGEFRELIEMRAEFEQVGVKVVTIETHDRYRARVMVGRELDPKYWFAKTSFKETYTRRIWWPHLLDRAGTIGAIYGVDPMAFSVHAEYINRPATIIVDPVGNVRFAYHGTFWGDRPSIKQTLDMIRAERFDFEHPQRLQAALPK